MSNLYLKTADEKAMLAALDKAGLVIDGVVQVCGRADVYVIGTMYDSEGLALPGFHANVRTTDESVLKTLEPLSCTVTSPAFVFA